MSGWGAWIIAFVGLMIYSVLDRIHSELKGIRRELEKMGRKP